MAKVLDYPRASLQRSLELAHAIDSLGGECTIDMAASKLNKKVTGAFSALASAAGKYGLVETRKQKMQTTELSGSTSSRTQPSKLSRYFGLPSFASRFFSSWRHDLKQNSFPLGSWKSC